mmetsp:Transcript_23338/g.59602  ORF Transcript_23338/g.59602 Transcript_23338/m.59602 type:complete len:233 (+) Transcript_23338:648-1346(+)
MAMESFCEMSRTRQIRSKLSTLMGGAGGFQPAAFLLRALSLLRLLSIRGGDSGADFDVRCKRWSCPLFETFGLRSWSRLVRSCFLSANGLPSRSLISGHSATKRCQKPSMFMAGATDRRASRSSDRLTSPEPSWSQMRNISKASRCDMPSFASAAHHSCVLRPFATHSCAESLLAPTAAEVVSRRAAVSVGYLLRSRSRRSRSSTEGATFVSAERNSSIVSTPSPLRSMTWK